MVASLENLNLRPSVQRNSRVLKYLLQILNTCYLKPFFSRRDSQANKSYLIKNITLCATQVLLHNFFCSITLVHFDGSIDLSDCGDNAKAQICPRSNSKARIIFFIYLVLASSKTLSKMPKKKGKHSYS